MADPKQYASMLRERARSIREQLKLLDKQKGSLLNRHLSEAIATTLQQQTEKPLHLCKGF